MQFYKHSSFIVDLPTVEAINSSYFIEIQQGFYSIHSKIWHQNSIYIYGDIWANIFHELFNDTITGYDFFGFTHVPNAECQILIQRLQDLIPFIQKVQTLDDFSTPPLLAKSGEAYIRFDNGIFEIFNQNQNIVAEQFAHHFNSNLAKIITSYRDLADWLIEHSQQGISILGI